MQDWNSDYNQAVLAAVEQEIAGITKALSEEYEKVRSDPYAVGTVYSASGLVVLALSMAALSPGIGIIAGLTAGMAAASGIATAGVGMAQLLAAAFGGQNVISNSKPSIDLALELSSNPYSLVFGTIGATSNGELKAGVEVGTLVSATIGIGGSVNSLMKGEAIESHSVMSGAISLYEVGSALEKVKRARESDASKVVSSVTGPAGSGQGNRAVDPNEAMEIHRQDQEERRRNVEREAERLAEIQKAIKEWERQQSKHAKEREHAEEERKERQKKEELENERRRKEAEEQLRIALERARRAAEESAAREQEKAEQAQRDLRNAENIQRAYQSASGGGGGSSSSNRSDPPERPINMLP